jgi:hypothetical protein
MKDANGTPIFGNAPTEQIEIEALRRHGWSDDEIVGMTPEQRRREFQEAIASEDFLSGQSENQAAIAPALPKPEGGAEVPPSGGTSTPPGPEPSPKCAPARENPAKAADHAPTKSFSGKLIYAGCAAIFLFSIFQLIFEKREEPQAVPGWDEISNCSFMVSFDGKRHLWLSENHFARIEEPDRASLDGSWSFNEGVANYTITVHDQPITYSVVAPADGGSCMLIKGDLATADLPQSWFYSRDDVDAQSDHDLPER